MTYDYRNDIVRGHLEVGLTNTEQEIVINQKNVKLDKEGSCYIIFSANQARHLAHLLLKHAKHIDKRPYVSKPRD